MKTVENAFVLGLVAAGLVLGTAGCNMEERKAGADHPKGEHPAAVTNEHPKAEHPNAEHPKAGGAGTADEGSGTK